MGAASGSQRQASGRKRSSSAAAVLRDTPQRALPAAGETLRKALAENRRYAPVLRGGTICNHYSMGMLAAHGLGADDRQLAFLHDYLDGRSRVPHEEAANKAQAPSGQDWTWGLGNLASASSMRAFFLEELRSKGLDAALEAYLPRLCLGQHKGLFHPMIRLQFGLFSPFEPLEEAAEALAYSYGRHQPLFRGAPERFATSLQAGTAPVGEESVQALEEKMHKAFAQLRKMYKARGYTGKKKTMEVLSELYEDTALHQVALEGFPASAATALEGHFLSTQLAAQIYLYQPGLSTLHAVTGAHAVSDLLEKLPVGARVASAQLYFIWLCCLFVEKGAPQLRRFNEGAGPADAVPQWQAVRSRALVPLAEGIGRVEGSGEEPQVHVLKLAFTCDQLFLRSPHSIYLDVARKVVEQGKPW